MGGGPTSLPTENFIDSELTADVQTDFNLLRAHNLYLMPDTGSPGKNKNVPMTYPRDFFRNHAQRSCYADAKCSGPLNLKI